MAKPTLFSDFLTVLKVPHTQNYSDMRFKAYPTKLTMTALQDLLAEYGVLSRIDTIADKDVSRITAPCVIATSKGFMIVKDTADGVFDCLIKGSIHQKFSAMELEQIWTGEIITAKPMATAIEPDYTLHRRNCIANNIARIGFWAIAIAFGIFMFVHNQIWLSWSAIIALVLLGAGIYVTHLLVLEESHVESSAANKLCGVIEAGGCSTVLATKGSTFLGVLPWAEVGFTFFTVSFLALLLFPWATLPILAGISVLCLPFTIWSVSYQHFKAHAWCTMCLTVQSLFWLLFITYLLGNNFKHLFPLRWEVIISMGAAYAFVLCAIHILIPRLYHADRADYESMTAGGSDSVDAAPSSSSSSSSVTSSSSSSAASQVSESHLQ